ncbi:hypothetical protein D9M68_732650 [compost metagenome]
MWRLEPSKALLAAGMGAALVLKTGSIRMRCPPSCTKKEECPSQITTSCAGASALRSVLTAGIAPGGRGWPFSPKRVCIHIDHSDWSVVRMGVSIWLRNAPLAWLGERSMAASRSPLGSSPNTGCCR